MKVCGLTGGVGMGKSTVAEMLRTRGVKIIDTDWVARQVVEIGQPALVEIQQTFGLGVIAPDGQLRRDELARIVFSDPVARQKLEAILHPRIRAVWRQQIETWKSERQPLVVVVIPLLFEINAQAEFDATICIACSEKTQRARLRARGWTDKQISQRVAAQWPIEKKITGANFVIWTEGSLEVVAQQLDRILPKAL
ncbi:MAG: dephospho-CoA kinase [Verrucomicrobiota bacterium]